MASQPAHDLTGDSTWSVAELTRRLALAREPSPEDARAPRLLLLLAEMGWMFTPLRRMFRPFEVAKSANPQLVMLLPGFGAHPSRMRYMACKLEQAGHVAKRWGLGFNLGASKDKVERIERRVERIHAQTGRKLVLVGWSVGGLFARELAHRHPDKIAKVITMGSPFSGNPRSNNGWRLYQAVAGHRVCEPPTECDLREKPPVETVALWSPRDGVVHPRSACGRTGERDRSVGLRCNHMGFVYSKEAIATVLRELEDI
ncbi:alpha/beta hydrolase [Qipengyuania sp. JC766]|uniref:esterase/lipase family protein n=1 Tax=Qipengyuania sp. JC766 TaxID=3232139 RepID=UPI00345A94F2